jgi:hypothetical protein
MKKGFAKVSKEYLESALRLPDNIKIDDIYILPEDRINNDDITVILKGDKLPDECDEVKRQEGQKMPQLIIWFKSGQYHFCDRIEILK